MKYKLTQKAYGVDWSKISMGDYYQGNIRPVYTETRAKAKYLLLSELDGYELLLSDDEIKYTNAPVIRYKDYDLYMFEGKELTLNQIENEIYKQKRLVELQQILDDATISHCYIYKGGYYRPNSCGYTDRRDRAGVFTKEEAVSSAKSCLDISVIPIVKNEHNIMIQEQIDELKERLLV